MLSTTTHDARSGGSAAIPATRTLSCDLNTLEAWLRKLQMMRREIGSEAGAVIVMGLYAHGRDALNALGAPEALDSLIQTLEMAIATLADQHAEADRIECARRLFSLHGKDRASLRQYALGAPDTYRETAGTFGARRELRRAA